jgi:PAS domain S-box-containing protein
VNKKDKSIEELLQELDALKKENASLKNLYEKYNTEHKLTEEELKQTSQKWEAIVSTSPDGIGVATLEGKILLISDKLVKMHGYLDERPNDFLGKSIFDFIDPADHEKLSNNIRKLLMGDRDNKLTEYTGIRKDKSSFNIDVNSTVLLDSNGKPASILYVERDITERKLAEDALRVSEEKYRLIFEYSPVGVLSFDEHGVIVACNDKIVEIIGSSREALIGINMVKLPDEELVLSVKKALGGRIGLYEGVYHSVTANKSTLVRAIFTPMNIGYGINGGVGIIEDITEQKQAEEVLHKSNQKLEAIISASPDGIGIISLDGKMQFMSDKLIKMYGYSVDEKEEYIGKSVFDFVDSAYHKQLMDNIIKLLSGESDYKIREYLVIKKDNSRFYIDLNYTLLLDSDGKPASILFVERDSTERRQTELIIQEQFKQLQDINSAKDKLFSIIAHDLRSPFQDLIMLTELLSEGVGDISPEKLSELGKQMHENAKNLLKLLSNLLEWSRMQQGIFSFEPKVLNLSKIISENINLIVNSGEQKGIELINDVPKDQMIFADEDMLNSLLRNLLSNAVKFTKHGGKVNVSSKKIDNNMVEVSVKDTGIGMSAELCSKLFKIDEKVGRLGTDGEGSTGLGLLLCKEFIEKHGGKIWVESQVNVGSTFYFALQAEGEINN